MPKVEEIGRFMERMAPSELAANWDNVGILVNCETEVTDILISLDITEEVVREAEEKGCQLIVAHHPVIFKPLRSLNRGDVVFQMVQKNISAICMHTNLDAARGGVNDVLCEVLGIENPQPFTEDCVGRWGTVPEMSAVQLAQRCKEKLDAQIQMVDTQRPVQCVAVLGGSGGSELKEAVAAGADVFITGEASHHDAIDARSMGIGLIVAGHYATEFPVVPEMARRLAEKFPDVNVKCSCCNKDPYTYL